LHDVTAHRADQGMFVLRRSALIAVLAALLLTGGLVPPVAAEPPAPIPPTVTEVLEGLPAQERIHGVPDVRSFTQAPDAEPSTSRVVRTIPFSMVGFAHPAGAVLEFRTSPDGQEWGGWIEAEEMDEEPDPGSDEPPPVGARSFSDPHWVGEAEHLQIRISGASTDEVDVHLIDSLGLGRSLVQRVGGVLAAVFRGGQSPAVAAVEGPTVVSRAQWGADESWRTGTTAYATNARVAVVHHTAGSNDYTRDQARGVVQGIYSYHTRSLGWNDVGYNLLIDRYGTVYEGRHGGLERAVVGAHAGGWNTGTFGVALMGQHHSGAARYAPATAAAISRLIEVLAWKMDIHHIDAEAKATLTSGGASSSRYAQGTEVTVPTIIGHDSLSNTACPGSNVLGQIGWIRQQVRAMQEPMFVQPSVSPSTLDVPTRAGAAMEQVRFAADLKPAGQWTLQITDGKGEIVESTSGSGAELSHTWRPPPSPEVYAYVLSSPGRRPVTGEISVVASNVDRIGAAGSVSAATVDISRAAFPTPSSARYAVVSRVDVFADAMAGGPLAGEDGPLLLTGSDQLDAAVEAELERVLPPGRTVYVLGGESAISRGVADTLAQRWKVERLSGPERTATAAAVAEVVRGREGTMTVMVARAGPDAGSPWADALAGGAYGAKAGVPVLLTYTDTLTAPTRDALEGVTRTIVLGGTAAISDAVMRQLPSAERVGGATRAGTAVEIAERLWEHREGTAGQGVLVGDGFSPQAWTLALAASPLAARSSAPLLLTASDSLPPETRDHLLRLDYGGKDASGFVLGGTAAVADSVVAELSRLLE
jgi:putative cell wall-binding protein